MRRFVEVRGPDKTFFVMDMKDRDNPKIVCTCSGFKGPLNAEYICDALEAYHRELRTIFKLEGG